MPKRQEEEELEWMSRKDDILTLYVEQDKSLSEVMHAMASQGFARTKPQYERSFKRWCISKNVRKDEWNFILDRLDKRNRPTNVKVRGVVIPQARLERQRLRKRETVFDLCKSKLHPQPHSRTPPGIQISTPQATTNENHLEVREDAKRVTHLDYVAPAASNPREPHLQVQEDDHVLLPTATTAAVVPASLDAVDYVPTEIPLKATHAPRPSSFSISGTPLSSCSDPLHDYMRAAIFVSENEISKIIPAPERYCLCYEYEQPTRELLRHVCSELLQAFVQCTLPKDDLYDVVRASGTANDLILLRRLLLVTKTNVRWRSFNEKLLFYAAQDGNECLLKTLIDVGVDINVRRSFGPPFLVSHRINVLQFATLAGHKNVIEILDNHGATIFTGWEFDDCAFIFDTIAQNIGEFTKPLFARAATSNVSTVRKGIAVLVLAVQHSYDSIVSTLLEAGFNPYFELHKYPFNIEILDTQSAFVVALSAMKIIYVEDFLKFPCTGLNKEHCQERLRQLTAGYIFAHCSGEFELRSAILDTGLHPDYVRQVMGYDYVQWYLYDSLNRAVVCDNCIRVDRLIQLGARPNYSPVMGASAFPKTLLQLAVLRNNMTIVRQLIGAGADVNHLDSRSKETPLQTAVSMRRLGIVRLLIEAGANVNPPPHRWRLSAVEIAATDGNLETVTYLLESGANIQGRHNRNYRRTLFRAKQHGFDSIVALLQEWKRSEYGEQDCDTVDNIMNTMTQDELDFPSEEARIEYLEREQSAT